MALDETNATVECLAFIATQKNIRDDMSIVGHLGDGFNTRLV